MSESREKRRVPVPVRALYFNFSTPISGPGLSVVSSIQHRDCHKDSQHTIEWEPWARRFRVTYLPRNGKEQETFFVPESKPDNYMELEKKDLGEWAKPKPKK